MIVGSAFAGAASASRSSWRETFETWHTGAFVVLLTVLCLSAAATSWSITGAWSAGLLLFGGALIGVPHGGSDFIVAFRTLRPRYGRGWLPVFVSAYLAIVGIVMAGWAHMPLSTLFLFLGASALHFGKREGKARSPLVFVAAAVTPVLPIFMFHPAEVGPVLAAMVGASDRDAIAALIRLADGAVWPWLATIAAATVRLLTDRRSTLGSFLDVAELGLLSLAAWLLPPLLTFGLYFCLLHSIRNMADLSSQASPSDPAKGLLFASVVIAPFSALCCLALLLFWDALAGTVGTTTLLCYALQLLAALTVPHMILEALSDATSAASDRNQTGPAGCSSLTALSSTRPRRT